MAKCVLQPPLSTRGMTKLVKESFTKSFSIHAISVHTKDINKVLPKFKKYLLKLQNHSPVRGIDNNVDNKEILLNPDLIQSKECLQNILKELNIQENIEIKETEINVTYSNWDKDQLISAVLPKELKGASSFSLVGHILHLNLRELMEPYKYIIAEILLDKLANISTVVNKTNIIEESDSDFRSFSMEILAGEGDMIATVKENGCHFKFDFSKVYWNTRLSTEHSRICEKLNKCDILFDVMAGVGPFSIPIAKKSCKVFANDLNPISVKYLKENTISNKVEKHIDIYNIDGNIFIKTIFKEEYMKYIEKCSTNHIHITMNLPSVSLQFLSSFICLFKEYDEKLPNIKNSNLPILHIYFFLPNDSAEMALKNVAENLYPSYKSPEKLLKSFLIEVTFVRRVSPSKVMMRVSCHIPADVLFANRNISEPLFKKIKFN